MGRRLVVLGSAPAFEEVEDEEGVEDAISSVVPGPLRSGVLGVLGARPGCKKKRNLCGEGFWSPAYRRRRSGRSGVCVRVQTLPLKSRCGRERGRKGSELAGLGCAVAGGRRRSER